MVRIVHPGRSPTFSYDKLKIQLIMKEGRRDPDTIMIEDCVMKYFIERSGSCRSLINEIENYLDIDDNDDADNFHYDYHRVSDSHFNDRLGSLIIMCTSRCCLNFSYRYDIRQI